MTIDDLIAVREAAWNCLGHPQRTIEYFSCHTFSTDSA